MHKVAFAGFRHSHIFDLYQRVHDHPDLEMVATCEENPGASLMPAKSLTPDFTSFGKLLEEADFDILALGDCYGKRGAQAIAALRAGKHIIADKPLCTSLQELDEIVSLAHAGHLRVGLMLDLRDHGNWIALRETVASESIGAVQTVAFSAQHPLMWGTRPGWYFEPGMHGGILNDIGIHAVDFIPWITGLEITEITAARTWNAKATKAPHFNDCGQLLLRLGNGGGVIGDVSYLAPDGCGYKTDNYWRVTVHGTHGFAETSYGRPGVTIATDYDKEPLLLPPAAARPGGYLNDFLADIAGNPLPNGRTTQSNLQATRIALDMEAYTK